MELQIKTQDDKGNIILEGTLSDKELDFVVNVGINFLLANGASPFFKNKESTETTIAPSTETIQ